MKKEYVIPESCFDCAFFMRFYIKTITHFLKTAYGRCEGRHRKGIIHTTENDAICKYFVKADPDKEWAARLQSTAGQLCILSDKLNEIKELLRNAKSFDNNS